MEINHFDFSCFPECCTNITIIIKRLDCYILQSIFSLTKNNNNCLNFILNFCENKIDLRLIITFSEFMLLVRFRKKHIWLFNQKVVVKTYVEF